MTRNTTPASPPRRALGAAPPQSEPALRAGTAALVFFALALLYFLPAFLPGRHIFGTDYLNAGYFFYDFISERTAQGELPKWVPYVYGGVPLFSNPGSTYYPVRWLSDFLLPTAYFFPLLFVVQFGMAGLGMYLLARELEVRGWLAFLAGLAFQWTGITTSWVYAGHDGRIIVVTLAPLLFFFLHRGVRTGRLAPFAGAAATVGFVLLSFQIQNAYYLLLGAAAWGVFSLFANGVHRHPARLGRTVGLALAAVAFGFAMGAVNFLPFLDYVGQSPRGATEGRGYEFSTSYSMPLRAVVGVAVPEQVGATISNQRGEYVFPVYRGENAFRLHTEYLGALVVVMVALGAAYVRRNRYWWFFAGLGLFALSLSLGGNTPLYRLYYEVLPGLKRFRAPDLAYYLLALSLIAMAAIAMERLAGLREAARSRRGGSDGTAPELGAARWVILGVVGAAVLGAALLGVPAAGMAEGTIGLTPAQGWMRFAVFAALVGAATWAWLSGRIGPRAALLALALVTVLDLWAVGRKFFQTVESPRVMFAADDVTNFLRAQEQPSRFWPIQGQSYWPATIDAPMLFDLENAGGEHGNQLQRYNQYAGAGERTYVDFHNFNDPRFLAAANVRWLVSSAPVEAPFLRPAFQGRSATVYENTLALPRAYLVPEVIRVAGPERSLEALQSDAWDPARNAVVVSPTDLGLPGGPLEGGAEVVAYEPDRVVVRARASRPALLVLSDNWYEGWRADVDGTPATVHLTNHTFRGVVVPAGEHTVTFTFEPEALYTGFFVYLASLGLLAAYGAWLLVGRARRPRAAAAAPE